MKPIPKHLAIIMDGNGRWAKARYLPRAAGHRAGMETVRSIVKACGERGITALTLFAFSSENWKRPEQEVSTLMDLFQRALQNEVNKLHENKVRLRIIGERQLLPSSLQTLIASAEALTEKNTGLMLNIAINYGGRADIVCAAKAMAERFQQNAITLADFTENEFATHLALADLPEPDLLIRTSGEQRISNFLLWQLAYSEFYFTEKNWPDFSEADLDEAIRVYQSRHRRFGDVGEKLTDVTEK